MTPVHFYNQYQIYLCYDSFCKPIFIINVTIWTIYHIKCQVGKLGIILKWTIVFCLINLSFTRAEFLKLQTISFSNSKSMHLPYTLQWRFITEAIKNTDSTYKNLFLRVFDVTYKNFFMNYWYDHNIAIWIYLVSMKRFVWSLFFNWFLKFAS